MREALPAERFGPELPGARLAAFRRRPLQEAMPAARLVLAQPGALERLQALTGQVDGRQACRCQPARLPETPLVMPAASRQVLFFARFFLLP